jgi:glycosyltransferase involved in cell wall biosynthesis
MRIAMIGHKKIPSREGGIEIVVEELAVRMVKEGHQVDVYNRWEPLLKNGKEIPKHYKGIRGIRIPTFQSSTLNAFVYSVLASVRVLFGKYDVIHYHAEGPCAMMWLPKLFGIPVVSTIHGLDWQRAKWGGFATKYLLWGEKCAVHCSDEMIVLSHEMKRYFRDTYEKESVYLSNGVSIPVKRKANQITKKFDLHKNGYILYLGRLVPEKGIHHLLRAFREVSTDKKLVIAGRIDRKSEYVRELCQEAEKDSRVVMTDFVHGQVLEELYSNCFLFVLPSSLEGMSISLLEAMSYGAHCLLSDISENREAAEGYADYFDQKDENMLQHKLQELVDRKEGYDTESQINFVKERYNWDRVAHETLNIYEDVIAGKKLSQAADGLNYENFNGK